MTQKKGEIENILKITSPGPVLLRRGSQRDIYLTRSRDQIIVDIEKRDVKPFYWDQITAHFGEMNPPGYRSGVFPLKCDKGSIEILRVHLVRNNVKMDPVHLVILLLHHVHAKEKLGAD